MKLRFKRTLALVIALLLAMPGFAYMEPADGVEGEYNIPSEDIDAPVGEMGEFAMGDPEDGIPLEAPTPIDPAEPVAPAAFSQSATVDGVEFAMTADAGTFPTDAALFVGHPEDEMLTEAAMQSVEALLQRAVAHHLYSIEVLDAEGFPCAPVEGAGLPRVVVNGLETGEAPRVIAYDGDLGGCYEIEVTRDEFGVGFDFAQSGIYDFVKGVEESEPEEPTGGEGTEGEEPFPEGEALEETEGEPTGETEEGEGTEGETTSSDPSRGDGPASPEGEALETEEPTDLQEPSPEGEELEGQTEGPAPVAFEQSMTVNDVAVTVRAEAGAFPANAVLSLKRVPTYRQRKADAAIEDVRDEDANVVVSYTFDIKVIDPDTKEELQPAESCAVEVRFALSEASDDSLEANVYHVTDAGGALTAEKLDTDVDAADETVTATTDGFSLYTVEFILISI